MGKFVGRSTTSVPIAPRGQPITGAELRQMLHGKSNPFRAVVAARFRNGTYVLVDPSPVQAARLCDVNVGYVTAQLGCAVRYGPRDSTIEKINKVVRKYGIAPLMAGLDRATTPGNCASNTHVA